MAYSWDSLKDHEKLERLRKSLEQTIAALNSVASFHEASKNETGAFRADVEELKGCLLANETIAMMALGMYLGNVKNDPDYEKAQAAIEHMRSAIRTDARKLSPAARNSAESHGEHLLSVVIENLRSLRGKSGRVN